MHRRCASRRTRRNADHGRCCAGSCRLPPMTATGRPNVLLIMADQLAASWLPAYGHDVVQAPNLTALAEGSTVYDAAYCPSPLCAPSRSALLAGRLPSRIGVYDNAAEM